MPSSINRRDLLQSLGIAASTLVTPSLFARNRYHVTAAEIMGPYYPLMRPMDEDADLTRIAGQAGRALGRVFDLHGRIIDTAGTPVVGAKVEMWQANSHGRYAHRSDPNIAAPLDPAFQGFGRQDSDRHGLFRFRTIVPGPYPVIDGQDRWIRAPHVHFDIRGRHDRLVTQIYFSGQPLNASDRLHHALSPEERDTVTLTLQPSDIAGEPEQGLWTVVLASG